jgi:hypothetical protein
MGTYWKDYPANVSQTEQISVVVSFMILPAVKLTEQAEDLNEAGKSCGRRFL